MMAGGDGSRYLVRLSVPRVGGWRAWGAVRGGFERGLARQHSRAVTEVHIVSETRRGRDYVRVIVASTVEAPDVARALSVAWRAFQRAASDDPAGWDMASAAAEVRPLS